MYEIEVEVSRSWAEDEEALMVRVAGIVCSGIRMTPCRAGSTAHGYEWALERDDDEWFATLRGNKLGIAYRYGHERRMEALKEFLEWSLIVGSRS